MHGLNFLAPQYHVTKHGMERTTMHWIHRLQESFWQHIPRGTPENIETLWTTPEDSRPHQRPLQKLWVQCTDGYHSNRLFSCEVRCTPRMHSITNTVQYYPRLHYEADYTECTSWYTVDHVLSIRRPGLCRWHCTIINKCKTPVVESKCSQWKRKESWTSH